MWRVSFQRPAFVRYDETIHVEFLGVSLQYCIICDVTFTGVENIFLLSPVVWYRGIENAWKIGGLDFDDFQLLRAHELAS